MARGTEKYLSLIKGVVETEVGYANGNTENPSYEDVCRRNTGHAETVKVIYNPDEIDLENLLKLFYKAIDPVAVNRQGYDIGSQYRTGVYYVDKENEAVIKASLDELFSGTVLNCSLFFGFSGTFRGQFFSFLQGHYERSRSQRTKRTVPEILFTIIHYLVEFP